jgi:hypothetical protein
LVLNYLFFQQIFTGYKPYHRFVEGTVILKVHRGLLPPRESGVPDTFWAVLLRCWSLPAMRPSAHAFSLFCNTFLLLGEWNFFLPEALGIVGVQQVPEHRFPVAMTSVA